MLVRIFILWLAIVAGLWLSSRVLTGVRFRSPLALGAGALVLGVLDATAGPLLVLATFPFTVITLGLFIFVVNAGVLMAAAFLVPGFDVDGIYEAFNAGLIVAAHALGGFLLGQWLFPGDAGLSLAARAVGFA